MRELGKLFERHDFNSFPVVEDKKMLGIVTKFDFLRAFAFTTGQMVPHYDELMRRPVAEVMTEAVVHVEPTAPLTRVLQLMVSLEEPQLSGYGARSSVARNDLSRGPDARTQRGNTGRLEPGIRTADFIPNPNIRDVNLSASTPLRESSFASIGH